MQQKLISVIVPVYNVEKYLTQCIESVLKQTYHMLELILIDDGSTDQSGEICDRYASVDERVQVFHQANKGRSAARNAGMQAAKGEYLMFVDSDDWIDETCLETVWAVTDEGTELVVFRSRNIYADKMEDHSTGERKHFTGSEPLTFYVGGYKDFQVLNAVWGKLYKKSLLADIRFEEGRYYEDVMFTTKTYAACRDCQYLDEAYYNYNIATENSITYQGVNELTFRDEIPIFYEKERYLEELGREDLSERYAYFLYQRLILYYNASVQKKEKDYAKRLAALIKRDKRKIRKVLKQEYVSAYNRLYIQIFLVNAKLAYFVKRLMEKIHK